MPADSLVVRGYDFNEGLDYHRLLRSYMTTGYQATSFAQAVVEGEVDVAELAGEWLALVVPVELGVAEVGHRCTRETRCGIVATCAKARRIR